MGVTGVVVLLLSALCQWHTYRKSAPKAGTGKPVLVFDASDMQFGTSFLVIWYVCHGHYSAVC